MKSSSYLCGSRRWCHIGYQQSAQHHKVHLHVWNSRLHAHTCTGECPHTHSNSKYSAHLHVHTQCETHSMVIFLSKSIIWAQRSERLMTKRERKAVINKERAKQTKRERDGKQRRTKNKEDYNESKMKSSAGGATDDWTVCFYLINRDFSVSTRSLKVTSWNLHAP